MALLVAVTARAHALSYKWSVQPYVGVSQIYTDNALLAPSNARRGDLVTDVSPGLRIDGKGPRLSASVSYTPSALVYWRNRQQDRVANILEAFGNLEAVEKTFFIDANGNISQQFISPFRPQPQNVTTATPNRTESRTFGVSPYVVGEFLGEAPYELRERSLWTGNSEHALPDAKLQEWQGSVAKAGGLLGAALEYADSRIGFDNPAGNADQHSSLWRGRLFLQPDPGLRLGVSAGQEANNYSSAAERRRSSLYGARISWKPSRRTAAELEAERRFFGVARLAFFSHRTRLTAWSIAYSRDASSYQKELLRVAPGSNVALLDAIFAARIDDPLERRNAVQQFLRKSATPLFIVSSLSFYTQQIFIEDRKEFSAAVLGTRNFVSVTAFHASATAISNTTPLLPADAFAAGRRIVQYGAGIDLNHRISGLSVVSASARSTRTRLEEPSTEALRNDYVALNFSHALSAKTSLFAGSSVSRFRSTSADEARAKSIFAGMNHLF